MKIFCDTNIIVELVEGRSQAMYVQQILDSATGKDEFFVSAGSFYTITYLTDRKIRRQGISDPIRTEIVKNILWTLLQRIQIANIDRDDFCATILSSDFSDLEDGYQYQAALACKADVLLTINIKDFKLADQEAVKILTPQEYIEQYPCG